MNRDMKPISDMRRHYEMGELSESLLPTNPFILFSDWFEDAIKSDIHEANAMVVATVDSLQHPNARIVLLKGFNSTHGFMFYTNYNSAKGIELRNNPNVSLVFYWDMLERQVRIKGIATPLCDELNDEYFDTRPDGSKIGAIISPQSQIIPDKKFLENKYKEQETCTDKLSRPSHWGGYSVMPTYFEFWQGRPNRLHDRHAYEKVADEWKKFRLAP